MTWLKLKFAAGVSAAALLAGGAATVAVSQTVGKGGDNLTPLEIAKQTQEAYAALTSYSDSGAVVATTGAATVTNTFHIRLQRPGFYRIDWAQPIAAAMYSKGVVWNEGDGDFMQMSAGKNVLAPEKKESRRNALASATGVSSSAAATIPGIFFAENSGDVLRIATSGKTKLMQEPDAKIGDVDCHVFTSAIDPAKLPSGGKLPNNMGTLGMSTTTLWIGKKDHLIRQVRQIIDSSHISMPTMSDDAIKSIIEKTKKPVTPEAVNAMRKMMAEATKQARMSNFTFTQTHENIVVNKKFSPADFAR